MMMTDPFEPPYGEDLFIAEDEVMEEEETTTSSESFVLLVKTTFSLLFHRSPYDTELISFESLAQ
jgi:hypothetical protein